MTVALYFGSFNPVHTGHLSLAEWLVEHEMADEVWFVVSPCNPLKRHTDLLDEHLRIEMIRLAIAGHPRLRASDVEFHLPVPSYTADTLAVLSAQYPDVQFSLVIGSDNALLFSRWRRADEILAHYPVLVYPRHGYDFTAVAATYPQMRLLPTPYYDVSSTDIRDAIARGDDTSGCLHPLVWQFIRQRGLYED